MTVAVRRWGLIILALGVGCKDGTPEAEPEAKVATVDEPAPVSPCDVVDARGKGTTVDVSDFGDPVARLVLSRGCPKTFDEVNKVLAEVDARDCDDDGFSPMRTTLLSERAQMRGTPDGSMDECAQKPIAIFRGVVQRNCGGRPSYGLFGSLAPLATVQDKLPDLIEMIGFDPKTGTFRFYTYEEERWRYHGDSFDMLEGMAPDGARRCAACHVGGGLVMKELDPPWLHWEGRTTTVGVLEMLNKHESLGSRSHGAVTDFRPAGKELEDAIIAGNEAWIAKRIEHQRANAPLKRLLRPLFCDEEINLSTAGQSPSPPTATTGEEGKFELPVAGFLAAKRLVGPETIKIDVANYHQVLAKANQRIDTFCDKPLLTDADETIVDTIFDFAYPHRSSIDNQAVDALVEAGIIDEAFVRAVLAVDLTRPVFSEARCGLLEHVPDVAADERTPAKIRSAVLEALAEVDTPAAKELRENLGPDARDPTARVSAMLRACADRPAAELASDLHAYASMLRDKARKNPVIELPEVLPVDDLPDRPDAHFDPDSCTLVGASAAPTSAE